MATHIRSYLFSLALLTAPCALLAEAPPARLPKAYENFSIEDFLWEDERDMKIDVSAAADGYGHDTNALRRDIVFFTNTDMHDNQFSLRLSPTLTLKDLRLSGGYNARLPLTIGGAYRAEGASATNAGVYTETVSNGAHTALSYSFHAAPTFAYANYFRACFVSVELGAEGAVAGARATNTLFVPETLFASDGAVIERASVKQDNETKRNAYSANATALTRIGGGRIYGGAYAYYAILIVYELNQQALLLKTVDALNMRELSKTIAIEKKTYDSENRAAVRAAVRRIANLLFQNEFAHRKNRDAVEATVEKIYDYSEGYNRQFGQSYGLRLGAGIAKSRNNEEYHIVKNDTREDFVSSTAGSVAVTNRGKSALDITAASSFIGAEFNMARPLNQYWQIDCSFMLDCYFLDRSYVVTNHEAANEETVFETQLARDSPRLQPQIDLWLRYFASSVFYIYFNANVKPSLFYHSHESAFRSGDDFTFIRASSVEYSRFSIQNALSLLLYYRVENRLTLSLLATLNHEYRYTLREHSSADDFSDRANALDWRVSVGFVYTLLDR